MKITGPGQARSPAIKKAGKKQSADGASFSDSIKSSTVSAPAPVTGTSPLTSVDAILALQQAGTATDGRSKGLRRADEMLDHLEEIRRGLLLGTIPVAKLKTLAALTHQNKDRFQDPKLSEIMGEIELRALVELAKLGVSP